MGPGIIPVLNITLEILRMALVQDCKTTTRLIIAVLHDSLLCG